jgi:hypothetical protein
MCPARRMRQSVLPLAMMLSVDRVLIKLPRFDAR